MSLIGRVGRKRPRARLATTVLYVVLCIGALTTVYPFLFMASTGFKGPTDQNDNKLVPAYWSDSEELLKKYRDDKYAGDINVLESYNTGAHSEPTQITSYNDFLMSLPDRMWKAGFRVPPQGVTSRLAVRWQQFLRIKYRSIDKLNVAHVDLNQSFQQVPIAIEAWEQPTWKPPKTIKWADWAEFRRTLPAEFRIPVRTQWMFQEWLRSKYKNRFSDVPVSTAAGAKSFGEVPMGETSPNMLSGSSDWAQFWNRYGPAYNWDSIEDRWRTHIGKTGSAMPILAAERQYLTLNRGAVTREFAVRNYLYVLDYILLHGRSLINTVLFCCLAVLAQVIVNPLAAYALSRFPMKATASVLLFLLATIAFPAEIAMIPSFLLLKKLNLLNTFAALVLPTTASGYTIYLLKGFFDSLPQEVFDSGQVDGAPEWLMMLKLALPLSKPVLGYIALLSFMASYGAFVYAFLVCQDSKMWTLMVFIYQLQITSPKAVVMAAVTLAAIPTVLVFLAFQRVIMRGIVLPGER